MSTHQVLFSALTAVLIGMALSGLDPQHATAQSIRSGAEVARACANVERSIPENSRKACAQALEKSLRATGSDIGALKASPKLMLSKHGLTQQQLEGAEIVVRNDTDGSGAERIDVTIKCCPLQIIIRL